MTPAKRSGADYDDRAKPKEKTLWQVRSSWSDGGPGTVQLDGPFEDRGEAWSAYHAALDDRSKGWKTDGGREFPGPREGFRVELVEYDLVLNGDKRWTQRGWERVVERSDVDPSQLHRTRTINVAALLDAARGQSGAAGGKVPEEMADPCVACGAPSTAYTPGGLPVCDGHMPTEEADQ